AIALLGRTKQHGVITFLRKLAENDKLTVPNQAALDKALVRSDSAAWSNSQARQQMFRRWLDEARLDYDAGDHLATRLAVGDLDYVTYIALIEPCFAKLGQYSAWQQDALLRLLDCSPRRAEDKALLFAFLTSLVRDSPSLRVRVAAARSLQRCRPLTDEQARIVRELRDATRDPAVVR